MLEVEKSLDKNTFWCETCGTLLVVTEQRLDWKSCKLIEINLKEI